MLKDLLIRMNRNLFKRTVFYILIIDHDNDDHFRLRRELAKSIPQAIIESIYDEGETINYFDRSSLTPSVILLDMNMKYLFLKLAMHLIRNNELTKNVPIVVINSNNNMKEMAELKQLGANEFFTRPYKRLELKVLAQDLKRRWLHA